MKNFEATTLSMLRDAAKKLPLHCVKSNRVELFVDVVELLTMAADRLQRTNDFAMKILCRCNKRMKLALVHQQTRFLMLYE